MKKFSFRIILTCAALVLAAPGFLSAQSSPDPIATIDGEPIFEQELMPVAGPTLLELRNQEYKAKNDALNKLIPKKLLDAEAKSRGITVEELLKKEVDSKIAGPSDDEAKGYWFAAKNQSTLPFDEIKPQIKQLLMSAEIQQAREKYADSLRAKAQVVVLLKSPQVTVSYDTGRVRGNPQAPITIVEFSDFQCPFCKKAQTTLKDLLEKYQGQLKVAFRDFPMRSLHSQAELAAEAARCAEGQGKFWEYHDALFADQTKFSVENLTGTARSLGLDEKSFQSCMATGEYKAQIEQDIQDGAQAGVAGTPGFFVNGVFLSGAQPEGAFEKIIDSQLAAAGRNGHSAGSAR